MIKAADYPENDTLIDLEEERLKRMVDLKMVGGSNNPPDGDWLSTLEIGTVFLVSDKIDLRQFNLVVYRLVGKTEKSYILRNPSVPQNIYVKSSFCNSHNLHEKLGLVLDDLEPKQEQEETTEETEHERDRVQE